MDNKTTDKGWAAMRALLDREMPEKRRRKFGWWWLGLLALPIVGYGSWQWLRHPDVPTPKMEAASALPLASLAPQTEYKNAPRSEQNAPIPSGKSTENYGNYASPRLQKTAESVFNAEKHAVESMFVPREDNPNSTDFEMLPNLQSAEITQDKTDALEQRQLSVDLVSMTPQPIDLQYIKPFLPHSLALAKVPKPVNKALYKHWMFGATSAISTEQFNSINGFSTGLSIDWKFARKWGLRTGVLYNIHTPQEKYRPVASVLSADYRSNVYGDVIVVDVATGQEITSITNNYGDSLAGKVFIPVNRLERLEVPLTVFWQAARPLKIIGGLSLTRTLTAKASRQNYSGDYILKLADRTAENGASRLSSSELDNWSADATIGAGVRFGRSFEFGFSAKMPLSKFPGIVRNSQPGTNSALADKSLGSTRKQNGQVFSLYGTLFF